MIHYYYTIHLVYFDYRKIGWREVRRDNIWMKVAPSFLEFPLFLTLFCDNIYSSDGQSLQLSIRPLFSANHYDDYFTASMALF